MKNAEFYVKHKINGPPVVNPFFYKRNPWRLIQLTLVAALIGPSIIYKRFGFNSFSIDAYLRLAAYCLLAAVPLVSLLFWVNWREALKKKRGYHWVGKFEVIKKQSSFVSRYLRIMPGYTLLRVERTFFDSVREGDFIIIRRDALGGIEEIRKDNFQARLARNSSRYYGKDYLETAL